MKHTISEIAFTSTVKAAQEKRGSRASYARMEKSGNPGPWGDVVTLELVEFITEQDAFYFGTASAEEQPYIQYRGGPKGFLKVLDQHTLAFADFAGNAQYISLGNLNENNKAFIFLMDYPNRSRIKIWGTAEFIEDDPELLQRVVDADYKSRPERVLLFNVKAWTPNCPQHIKKRFTVEEVAPTIQKLQQCIIELQEMNSSLRKQLSEAAPEPIAIELSTQDVESLITQAPMEGIGCGID